MTPPSRQPTNTDVKFSKKRLSLAFAIAGISDAIGAFVTPLPQNEAAPTKHPETHCHCDASASTT
jgi:hypothetical protein